MTSYEEDYDPLKDSKKTGIKKVSSQNSSVKVEKKTSKEDFEKAVSEVVHSKNDNKEKAIKAVLSFKKVMSDKTLNSNKNPILKEVEKKSLQDLMQTINELDNDENEDICAGSSIGITLLLSLVMSLKDRINELEYKLSKGEAP